MQIYITDKTGKKFWNTSLSAEWSKGEQRNLQRHLDAIKSGDPAYSKCNIDAATARIGQLTDKWDRPATSPMLRSDDGVQNLSDEELLAELMA
jgi:hypothetical protein